MNVTGAIFDMDGTLADSLGYWDVLWKHLGERYFKNPNFRPDPITAKAVRTTTLRDAALIIHENCKIGNTHEEVAKIVDDMLNNYYENIVQLKPGVIEFLEYLKKREVKMCIASATPPHLLTVLMKKFKLERYFSRVISCSEVGKGKESPDVFVFAHDYLGTPKESTWIFEDSIVAIETAHIAGYNTVGIYDSHNFELDRVKEISDVYIGEKNSLAELIEQI